MKSRSNKGKEKEKSREKSSVDTGRTKTSPKSIPRKPGSEGTFFNSSPSPENKSNSDPSRRGESPHSPLVQKYEAYKKLGGSFEKAIRVVDKAKGLSPKQKHRAHDQEIIFKELYNFLETIIPTAKKNNVYDALSQSIGDGFSLRISSYEVEVDRNYGRFHAKAKDFKDYIAKMEVEEFKDFCHQFISENNQSNASPEKLDELKSNTASLIVFLFLSDEAKKFDENYKLNVNDFLDEKNTRNIYEYCREILEDIELSRPSSYPGLK